MIQITVWQRLLLPARTTSGRKIMRLQSCGFGFFGRDCLKVGCYCVCETMPSLTDMIQQARHPIGGIFLVIGVGVHNWLYTRYRPTSHTLSSVNQGPASESRMQSIKLPVKNFLLPFLFVHPRRLRWGGSFSFSFRYSYSAPLRVRPTVSCGYQGGAQCGKKSPRTRTGKQTANGTVTTTTVKQSKSRSSVVRPRQALWRGPNYTTNWVSGAVGTPAEFKEGPLLLCIR